MTDRELCHEVRNLINCCLGLLELSLLEFKGIAPPKMQERGERIKKALEGILEIIERHKGTGNE